MTFLQLFRYIKFWSLQRITHFNSILPTTRWALYTYLFCKSIAFINKPDIQQPIRLQENATHKSLTFDMLHNADIYH